MDREKSIDAIRRIESVSERFRDGGRVFLEGEELLLSFSDNISRAKRKGGTILCPPGDIASVRHALSFFYRKEAKSILSQRIEILAKRHGFAFKKIRITSAKTRWGSCSSKGTLSFSFRLIMAPIRIIDSVILHELCHTWEMNHSKRFYRLLRTVDPEYRHHDRWLKDNRGIMMV